MSRKWGGSSKWTEAMTLKLVYCYKLHECLWNQKNELYSVKNARTAAYNSLIAQMDLPELDEKGAKMKIKNLRAHYFTELKKIRLARVLGESYEPTLYWFKEMDSFMKDVVSTNLRQPPPEMITGEMITGDSIFDSSSIYENHFLLDGDSMEKPVPIFHQMPLPPQPTKKKKSKNTSALPAPFSKKRKTTPANQGNDLSNEFEVFGHSVSAQLRKLSVSRAMRAQTRIQTVLTEERIQDLDSNQPSSSSRPDSPDIVPLTTQPKRIRINNDVTSSTNGSLNIPVISNIRTLADDSMIGEEAIASLDDTDISICFEDSNTSNNDNNAPETTSTNDKTAPTASSSNGNTAPTATSSNDNNTPTATSSNDNNAPTATNSNDNNTPVTSSSNCIDSPVGESAANQNINSNNDSDVDSTQDIANSLNMLKELTELVSGISNVKKEKEEPKPSDVVNIKKEKEETNPSDVSNVKKEDEKSKPIDKISQLASSESFVKPEYELITLDEEDPFEGV